MASLLRDISEGLVQFWQTKLPMASVRLGFPSVTDEEESQADAGEPTRSYPAASLTLIASSLDLARRVSGPPIEWKNHPTDPTKMSGTRPPIAVTLTFQLDTFADKRDDDWTMWGICMQILGVARSKFTTPAGRELYLVSESQDSLDDLAGDSIWRKALRFRIETWLPDQEEALEVYRVLVRHFVIEGEHYVIDSRT